jgi:hypothetical protein
MQKRTEVEIKHTFNGLLPHEVRTQIRKHKDRFDHMLLIEEAHGWIYQHKVETRRRPRPVIDPLIVGLKKGQGYLITAFDLQPIEEAVAREFTRGQNRLNFC